MSTKKSKVRLGLMGSGKRLRGVVANLLKVADHQIEVVAMYDPDSGSQEATRTRFGSEVINCVTEEELAHHASVDWIFVGSTNAHHARQAILALQAGKNVFCEKPLAIDLDDCQLVRKVVRETGRTFAFGLVLRYSPHYQKIYEIVQSGALGELISFEFNETLRYTHGGFIFGNWRRSRKLAGTHLLEKCCHDLDLANWIIGRRPRRAASFGGKDFFLPANERHIARIGPDAEGRAAYHGGTNPHRVNPFSEGSDIVDNQVVILEYENGVRGTFHTNCNAGIPERRFYLCGTEGSLRGNAYSGQIEWKRIGPDTTMETSQTAIGDGHAGGDTVMANSLVNTILHEKPPLASVNEGFLACITAAGIDEAMDRGVIINYKDLYRKYLDVP